MGDIGTAVAGGLSSGASVLNNERNLLEQKKNQQREHDFQSAENEKDRLWQEEQWTKQFSSENEEWERRFDLQNEYNDPSAVVSRLQSAGINPAAALGSLTGTGGIAAAGGSSQPASPGQMPSHAVTTMGISPMSGVDVRGMMSGVSDLLNAKTNAKRLGLDTEYQNATIEAVVDKLRSDSNYQDKAAALTETQNIIQQAIGDKEARARISNLMAQAALFDYQGKREESQTALNRTVESLTNLKSGIVEEAKPLLINNLKHIGNLYQSEAVRNYAGANLSNQQALTVEALRDGQVYGQELANTISGLRVSLESLDVQNAVTTNPQKVEALLSAYEREKWMTSEQKTKALMAIKDKDWQTVEKILNSVESSTRSLKNITGSVKDVSGAVKDVTSATYISNFLK